MSLHQGANCDDHNDWIRRNNRLLNPYHASNMTPHPSLSAPPVEVDPIIPVETMGPYQTCWCRSGKKYKWCHHRREQQEPINAFEVEANLIDELRSGYCSHPDSTNNTCSSKIINSHTVQKRGGLTAIAEGGHVLTVKPTLKGMIEAEGNPSPRKIGINNASVFPGFCGKHDDALFKPIEGKSLSLTKDNAFLFSYRAIAYERFAKEAQFRSISCQREADRGQPFWKQAMIQAYVHATAAGIKIGMNDIDQWKKQFDDHLLSGVRDNFHFLAIRFNQILPIVACGAFHPEYDLQGKPLQRLGRDSVDLEHMTLTVTTFDMQTIMVFGWIANKDGPAKALADSYQRVSDDRKADALIRLLFFQIDNLFIRPSWWSNLSNADQDTLNEMTRIGTTMRPHSGAELADSRKSFSTATVVEMISG